MYQGLWYEAARDRWRVKIVRSGVLIHRSYHHDYDEALRIWEDIQRDLLRSRPRLVTQPTSDIAKFLRQPPPGAGVVT
jgi:hypothetical protein